MPIFQFTVDIPEGVSMSLAKTQGWYPGMRDPENQLVSPFNYAVEAIQKFAKEVYRADQAETAAQAAREAALAAADTVNFVITEITQS